MPPRIGDPYVTPAGEKFDRLCIKVIAEFGGKTKQKGVYAMSAEKLAALREYKAEQRKLLNDKVDATMAKAQAVFPRAHAVAEREFSEVEGIDAELDLLDDEANQAIGGNRPPKDGSSSSGQSSGA